MKETSMDTAVHGGRLAIGQWLASLHGVQLGRLRPADGPASTALGASGDFIPTIRSTTAWMK